MEFSVSPSLSFLLSYFPVFSLSISSPVPERKNDGFLEREISGKEDFSKEGILEREISIS